MKALTYITIITLVVSSGPLLSKEPSTNKSLGKQLWSEIHDYQKSIEHKRRIREIDAIIDHARIKRKYHDYHESNGASAQYLLENHEYFMIHQPAKSDAYRKSEESIRRYLQARAKREQADKEFYCSVSKKCY